MLSPYRAAGTHNQMIESGAHPQETSEIASQPFVSLLEFVSEIYQVYILAPLLTAHANLVIMFVMEIILLNQAMNKQKYIICFE